MKIIDLLNKIANGEEVPKKIKYDGQEYKITKILLEDNNYYFNYINEDMECIFPINTNHLNDEIEILEEEKKIPEKLEDISEIKCVGCKVEINIVGNKTLFDTDTPIVTEHCIYKINQLIKNKKKIIDYLKSKGE